MSSDTEIFAIYKHRLTIILGHILVWYVLYMLTMSEYIFTSADALPGVLRWQSRLWQLVTKLRGARQLGDLPIPTSLKKKELAEAKKIWENMNYTIQEVRTPQAWINGGKHVWHELICVAEGRSNGAKNNSQWSSSLILGSLLLFTFDCNVLAK